MKGVSWTRTPTFEWVAQTPSAFQRARVPDITPTTHRRTSKHFSHTQSPYRTHIRNQPASTPQVYHPLMVTLQPHYPLHHVQLRNNLDPSPVPGSRTSIAPQDSTAPPPPDSPPDRHPLCYYRSITPTQQPRATTKGVSPTNIKNRVNLVCTPTFHLTHHNHDGLH